jgi:hypothetical protein
VGVVIGMEFSKCLYVSPLLANKKKKVMWKLRTGRPQPTVFVIALSKNNDLFEIYHSAMLKQKYYKKKANAPYIVGIAAGYYGAVDLVIEMLKDVLMVTGGYDVKAYFRD